MMSATWYESSYKNTIAKKHNQFIGCMKAETKEQLKSQDSGTKKKKKKKSTPSCF